MVSNHQVLGNPRYFQRFIFMFNYLCPCEWTSCVWMLVKERRRHQIPGAGGTSSVQSTNIGARSKPCHSGKAACAYDHRAISSAPGVNVYKTVDNTWDSERVKGAFSHSSSDICSSYGIPIFCKVINKRWQLTDIWRTPGK